MDDLLIRVMVNLVRVHEELGEDSFQKAAQRVLVTIARSVQLDAESNAGVVPTDLGDTVVAFPADGSKSIKVPSRQV